MQRSSRPPPLPQGVLELRLVGVVLSALANLHRPLDGEEMRGEEDGVASVEGLEEQDLAGSGASDVEAELRRNVSSRRRADKVVLDTVLPDALRR